jgi:hypothetical protein
MSVALIVIPDPSAFSREHRFDAQQVFHLPWFEDPALRVNQGDALTAEIEPDRQIGEIKHAALSGSGSVRALNWLDPSGERVISAGW